MSDAPTTLADFGETEIIRRLTAGLEISGDVVVGVGDDCAVVRPSADSLEDWVFTSDPVIEGRHVEPSTDPGAIGHKAIARALSDLAAMGAEPRWAVVNVTAPPEYPMARLEAVYAGLRSTASRFGLSIVGGDVAQSAPLSLHVFACGALPRGSACLRSAVQPGDLLYVTGRLGGSGAGGHLTFTPRVTEGRWLRDRVNAMIDISDGLASELRHLATASTVELRVENARIPLALPHPETPPRPGHDTTPLDHALHDGEDFELLFSLPNSAAAALERDWPPGFPLLTRIGAAAAAAAGGRVLLIAADGAESELTSGGYRHFGKRA